MSDAFLDQPPLPTDSAERMAAIERAFAVLIRYRAKMQIINAGLDHAHVQLQITHERLAGFEIVLRDEDPMRYQVAMLVNSLIALERNEMSRVRSDPYAPGGRLAWIGAQREARAIAMKCGRRSHPSREESLAMVKAALAEMVRAGEIVETIGDDGVARYGMPPNL